MYYPLLSDGTSLYYNHERLQCKLYLERLENENASNRTFTFACIDLKEVTLKHNVAAEGDEQYRKWIDACHNVTNNS